MHILIILCNYYISNKGLLQEGDKEENLEASGVSTTSRLTKRL